MNVTKKCRQHQNWLAAFVTRFFDIGDKTKMLTEIKFWWHTYTSFMAIVDNFICNYSWIFNIVEFPE